MGWKNYILGGSPTESPPEEKLDGTAIREAFDEVQTKILGSVDRKLSDAVTPLSEQLKAFQPIVEHYKSESEEKRKEDEEKDAIAKINQSRIARGLKPLVEAEDRKEEKNDDMDDERKEKAPGKHDKDARLEKLEGKIDGILKGIQQAGLGVQDPLNVDVVQNGNAENQLTLKNNGKTVPFEKSWEFALETAPAIKSAMQENGFTQDAVDEFDIAVANLKFDLKKEGVQPPVRRGNFA